MVGHAIANATNIGVCQWGRRFWDLFALLVSLASFVSSRCVCLAPGLAIRTRYNLGKIRIADVSTALTLAVIAKRPPSGARGWGCLGMVLALTTLRSAASLKDPCLSSHPEHVETSRATIDERSMVIGLEIDEQAPAWPVRTLVPHHIVHEPVGAQLVLAAWCAVCNSHLVYDGTVDAWSLQFAPATVWRTNTIMRDRETGKLGAVHR